MVALEMLWVWVYKYVLGPITFIAPLPTSPLQLSQSVTNNRCAPSSGAQEKSEGAHQKIFGRRLAPALCPHFQIASYTTGLIYLWQLSTDSAYLPASRRDRFQIADNSCCVPTNAQQMHDSAQVPLSEMVCDLVCRVARINSVDDKINARKAEKENGLWCQEKGCRRKGGKEWERACVGKKRVTV